MFFTTLLAATCATFASAFPTPDVTDPNDPAHTLRDGTALASNAPPGTFSVSDFLLVPGVGFPWWLSVSVEGNVAHHPSVKGTYHIQGDFYKTPNYVPVKVSATQEVAAYVKQGASKDSYTLLLKYTVKEKGATYTYFGQTPVIARILNPSVNQTPPPKEFKVRETYSTVTH